MTTSYGVHIHNKKGQVLATTSDSKPAIIEITKGQGKVIFVAANLSLKGIHALINNVLKQKNISKDVILTVDKDTEEFPYIEAQKVGDKDRFLLYVHNWGGKKRTIQIDIPFSGEYYARNILRTADKAKVVSKTFSFSADSVSPSIWLLESKAVKPMHIPQTSIKKSAIINKIGELLNDPKENTGNPKVLFIEQQREPQTGPFVKAHMPARIAYPNLSHMLKSASADIIGIDSDKITEEYLKNFKAIIITETSSVNIAKLRTNKKVINALLDYVKAGGNLLVCASSMATVVNARQSIWWVLGPKFGISAREYLRDDKSHGYNDPYQIKITELGDHVVAKNLKEIQMFVCRKFNISDKSPLKPILSNQGRPVMIGGKYGKGEVIFCSDVMWMQPTRAEVADNVILLNNIVNLLLGKPQEKLSKEKLVERLILTEAQLIEMEKEEK